MATTAEERQVINHVLLLPVAQISPNPAQPRRSFSEDSLNELAQSIRENGLLQPISVRITGVGQYQLIAGERRLRAYKKLGFPDIPAIVEQMNDLTGNTFALIENLQRDNLNFFEQAAAIRRLMKEYALSQKDVAQKLGMAPSTVANKLRLLRLEGEEREKIVRHGLTERHARCLLQIEDHKLRLEAIEQIVRKQLNVAQTEQLIAMYLESRKPKPKRLFILKDVRIFINTVNKAVETMKLAGIPVSTERSEDDAYINVTVRIPKKAATKSTA